MILHIKFKYQVPKAIFHSYNVNYSKLRDSLFDTQYRIVLEVVYFVFKQASARKCINIDINN